MADLAPPSILSGHWPPAARLASLPLTGAEHSPLSRIIHRGLRDAILGGTLQPGQVLRQEELARRFQASRAPLREALNLLEAEGLVVLRPRRGFAVTSLDARELLEILQLRIVMEEHAGYVATLARTAEDIARLRACVAAMDQLPVDRPGEAELGHWYALNRSFHDTLEAASGRRALCQMVSNLRAKVEPYIRLEVSMTKGLHEAQNEHHRLCDAFAAGDAVTVALLSRAHAVHTAQRLIAALHERGVAKDLPLSAVADTGSRPRRRAGSSKELK